MRGAGESACARELFFSNVKTDRRPRPAGTGSPRPPDHADAWPAYLSFGLGGWRAGRGGARAWAGGLIAGVFPHSAQGRLSPRERRASARSLALPPAPTPPPRRPRLPDPPHRSHMQPVRWARPGARDARRARQGAAPGRRPCAKADKEKRDASLSSRPSLFPHLEVGLVLDRVQVFQGGAVVQLVQDDHLVGVRGGGEEAEGDRVWGRGARTPAARSAVSGAERFLRSPPPPRRRTRSPPAPPAADRRPPAAVHPPAAQTGELPMRSGRRGWSVRGGRQAQAAGMPRVRARAFLFFSVGPRSRSPTLTLCPASTRRMTTCDAMKPAPPVTRMAPGT